MASNHTQRVANMRQSFFDQQLLDDQFIRNEAVDEGLRGFQEDFYNTYFQVADRLIWILRQKLREDPIDVESIQINLHEFRANTRSAGAVKVLTQINRCIECRSAMDFAGCLASLEEADMEIKSLKRKLKKYFKLKNQCPPSA